MAFIVRPKQQSPSQLAGPMVSALLAMIGAALAAWFAATATIRSAQMEGEAALELERQKFQFELIKRAIDGKDKAQASNDLQFVIKAGLLDDPGGRMMQALQDAHTVPRYELPDPVGGTLDRLGCFACHSAGGSSKLAPTFKGKLGTMVAMSGGGTHRYDESYIRESILDPAAKVTDGYAPSMPTYRGRLSDQEVDEVVCLVKALAAPTAQ